MNLRDLQPSPSELEPAPQIELQKLSERHKTAASLLAQGVGRAEIAQIVKYTPEYITWLSKQPLFKEYLAEMLEVSQVRLTALFEKSVDVISETMDSGSEDGKLKAARMQMEATGRLGRGQEAPPQASAGDRLERLAERLVGLLQHQRNRVVEGTVTSMEVSDGS